MQDLITAFCQFFWGVLRRVYLWGLGLILDPFDIYVRFKPENWWGPPKLADPLPIIIFFALVLWAAFLTYREVWAKVPFKGTPDWKVGDLFSYLIARSRHADEFEDYTDWINGALDDFHDKASLRTLTVWGRPRGDWVNQPASHRREIHEIPQRFWTEGHRVDMMSLIHAFTEGSHSQTDEPVVMHGGTQVQIHDDPGYVELHVNKRQAKTIWPEKPWWRQMCSRPRFWFTNDVDTEIAFAQAQAARERKTDKGPISVSVKLDASRIDDFSPIAAISVQARTKNLDDCMVYLEQFSGLWPDNMPNPLPLRTDAQIREDRGDRFQLSHTQSKTVPIIYRGQQRRNEWFFIDTNKQQHFAPARTYELVLGVYGDGTGRKFHMRVELTRAWGADVTVELAPHDFRLE